MSTEKEFKWDDNNVKEFVEQYFHHVDVPFQGYYFKNMAEDFKQSKLQSQDKPQPSSIDRIEVLKIGNRVDITTPEWPKAYYLQFCTSKEVHSDKFPAIKQAIEDVLNESDTINIDWASPPITEKFYSQSEVDTIRREEQANSEKLRVALDILSRIWYYGNFKIETVNERVLAGIMNELRLFPTTEVEILNRPSIQNYFEKYTNYTPTTQPKEEDKPVIIEDNDRCGICGGEMVYIRGRYPNTDKRKVCPTCTTERLEQISDLCSPEYGKAYQNKN